MKRRERVAVLVGVLVFSACSPRETLIEGFGADAKRLRVVNREVTKLQERSGVRLSAAPGNGVAWVEGTDFRSGTLEVDVRGQGRCSSFMSASPSLARTTILTRPST